MEISEGDDYYHEEEDGEEEEDFQSDDIEDEDEIHDDDDKGSFQVFSQAQLQSELKKLTTEIQEVLGITSAGIAHLLLMQSKWNKEKLINRYSEDPKRALQECGLDLSYYLPSHDKLSQSELAKKHLCTICLEESTGNKTFAMCCKHRFCRACWKTYLEVKIHNGITCLQSNCMASKCKMTVTEEMVQELVSSGAFASFSNFLIKSFVADNPHVKPCPAPGCQCWIRCEIKARKEAVTCSCGYRFCFSCDDYEIGDHLPANCHQVEEWMKKASDESENVNWMVANTKKCPKCRSPIEKNGGCMHMTCNRNGGGCGFEFCWLCRGDWAEHGSHTGGYYSCNKYDVSEAKNEDDKANNIKTELEYYMWHFHRYDSHRNAMKIADKQRQGAAERGLHLQNTLGVRSTDVKFLTEAAEQLITNQRVLMYSYVYGFYLDKKKEGEKNLFLYLQEDLEKHTNHLSEIYEETKIPTYQDFVSWKTDVTNYTRVTKKFLNQFVEGVMSGLAKQ